MVQISVRLIPGDNTSAGGIWLIVALIGTEREKVIHTLLSLPLRAIKTVFTYFEQ